MDYRETNIQSIDDIHKCRTHTNKHDLEKRCSKIIYNRVPKCASTTVERVISILSEERNFTYMSAEPPPSRGNFFRKTELQSFVETFMGYASPLVYVQHVHFVNFTSYKYDNPVYINLIRDPVERMISHYYFKLYGSMDNPYEPLKDMPQTIDRCVAQGKGFCYINAVLPYFCGQQLECRRSRNEYALQHAKKTSEQNYLVIGITEDLRNFMEVLEYVLPSYFTGATKTLKKIDTSSHNDTSTAYKAPIKPETRKQLRRELDLEYDFYYFVKQRFYKQLMKVRKARG